MIRFHLKTGEYGWLSNFASYPIVVDGVVWPTAEHYYQAAKFPGDPAWMEAIRAVPRPYDAWRMGRSPDHPRRADWDAVKDEVMLRALRAKFTQHPDLRDRLLDTGDAPLVEDSPADGYWGTGGNATGRNVLGCLLMQVRTELRQAQAAALSATADPAGM